MASGTISNTVRSKIAELALTLGVVIRFPLISSSTTCPL